MRSAVLGALVLVGCVVEPVCQDVSCLTDVPTDETDPTDVTDSDTPTEEPTDDEEDGLKTAIVRYEWVIATWPHAIRVVASCDGETLFDETDFAGASDTYGVDLAVEPGSVCHVDLYEARGAALPAGRVFLCDDPAGEWPAGRGAGPVSVGEVTAIPCTLGCTDPVAENFVPGANRNDGSCQYVDGCTREGATNFDPAATRDDGSCKFTGHASAHVTWKTDWSPGETTVQIKCDGFALYDQVGFSNWNFDYSYDFLVDAGRECTVVVADTWGAPGASGSVSVCETEIASWGTNVYANRQGELIEVAKFIAPDCSGCRDPQASNYDPDAKIADSSCIY